MDDRLDRVSAVFQAVADVLAGPCLRGRRQPPVPCWSVAGHARQYSAVRQASDVMRFALSGGLASIRFSRRRPVAHSGEIRTHWGL